MPLLLLKKPLNICILIALVLVSCARSGDDNELKTRELNLERKEKELKDFEQRLVAKELELKSRELLLDTLQEVADTTGVYDQNLVGNWTVNMKCIETSCEGSALGDTKTERWSISYYNNRVLARAMVGGQITRVYFGVFTESGLQLQSRPQNGDGSTTMNVFLKLVSKNRMEGTREINQDGNCKIIYSLGLLKSGNQSIKD